MDKDLSVLREQAGPQGHLAHDLTYASLVLRGLAQSDRLAHQDPGQLFPDHLAHQICKGQSCQGQQVPLVRDPLCPVDLLLDALQDLGRFKLDHRRDHRVPYLHQEDQWELMQQGLVLNQVVHYNLKSCGYLKKNLYWISTGLFL